MSTPIESVDQWLSQACAHGLSGEAHYYPPEGAVVVRKIRFRNVTETHLIVATSRLDRDRGEIPVGRPVTGHVLLRGTRYEFESTVDPRPLSQRNAPDDLLLLRKPTLLVAAQRREHLRVSVAALDPIEVTLVSSHAQHVEACAIDAAVFRATMVNISASGVGLLVHEDRFDPEKHAAPCFLTFHLPGVEETFHMLGMLRYARYVQASEAWRLGFAFRRWSGRSFTCDQYAITRFITEQERRLLRRRR